MKILNTIGEKYTDEAKSILETFGTVDYVSISQADLADKIGEYDIVIVGLGLRFDSVVLEKATKLKVIGTATTGLDHIDVDFAKGRGIEVMSLRSETEFLSTITGTAELGWGLLLDLARGISESINSVKKYEWDRESFRGIELRGKTLGVVGLGRLGKMMARYGKAFYMDVVAYDPHISDEDFDNLGVKSVTFEQLLKESDVVSINVHLKENTEHMFDDRAFAMMKSSSLLINTARGKIVDEEALFRALDSKKIAGYATDVLDGELGFHESFDQHSLVDYARLNNNLLISPHIGGMTVESRSSTDVFIAKKVKSFFQK